MLIPLTYTKNCLSEIIEIEDILTEVMSFFTAKELTNFEKTSKYFKKLSTYNKVWFNLCDLKETYDESINYKKRYIFYNQNRPIPYKPSEFIIEYSKSSKSQVCQFFTNFKLFFLVSKMYKKNQ